MNTRWILLGLMGCAAPRPAVVSHPPPVPLEASEARRVALFHELEAKVHEVHVFSPNTEKNLGFSWQADATELLAELRAATTRPKLQTALAHFGASLHDTHCAYRADGPDPRLRLPVRIGAFAQGSGFTFRVTKAKKGSGVAVGDVVQSFDGVAAADLVRTHRNVSNMNQLPLVAQDVASYLHRRRTSSSAARPGSTSTLVVAGADGIQKTATLVWSGSSQSADNGDFSADYSDKSCGPEAPEYGHGYGLTARGHGLCVYTSKQPAFARYPIVYQWTFRYWDDALDGQYVVSDQALLQRELAQANPSGVVLDLRNNGGGNNPNMFLDWWAPAPYVDMYTRVKLIPALAMRDDVEARLTNMSGTRADAYLAELSSRSGAAFTAPRPFACPATGCNGWDNRYVPGHRVTKAPIALVSGGGCNSACAAFVLVFERNRWAPILGSSTMAGYTTHRYRHVLPEGLGTLDFASSEDSATPDGPSVEGLPTQLTEAIPETWENHEDYAALLVERAVARLPH